MFYEAGFWCFGFWRYMDFQDKQTNSQRTHICMTFFGNKIIEPELVAGLDMSVRIAQRVVDILANGMRATPQRQSPHHQTKPRRTVDRPRQIKLIPAFTNSTLSSGTLVAQFGLLEEQTIGSEKFQTCTPNLQQHRQKNLKIN